MRAPLLARVVRTFASGFAATAQEKWIDGLANLAAFCWLFLAKPASIWEKLAPFIWLWVLICAWHLIRATRKVWMANLHQPETTHFRSKLTGLLIGFLFLLALLSYGVWRAEVASERTYAYLAPTAELMECEKRAFFVKIIGPRILSRVEVALKDNKSGRTYVQPFPEIDSGPLRTDQYLWFSPSSPWDEDYTVTVTSRESHSSQRLIVRSTHHQIQFATQVAVEDEASPALSCRDKLLPPSYALALKETRSCDEPMKLAEDVTSTLDIYSYQHPDGSVTVRRVRTSPSPSELDQQSDERHLTDYQKQLLRPVVKGYKGSRLRILYSGGANTRAYAEEWRQLFSESWKTSVPSFVPVGDERIIDVQITVGNKRQELEAKTLIDAFQSAGIKHRKFFSIDPAAGSDIVLWVGPRSPKDASPDQCSSPELKPTPGKPHNCDVIVQSSAVCPFVPE
jgi:hypothetical protein